MAFHEFVSTFPFYYLSTMYLRKPQTIYTSVASSKSFKHIIFPSLFAGVSVLF